MRESLEKVIADLKTRRQVCKRNGNQAGADAFLYAITSLEEVLATEEVKVWSNENGS